MGSSLWLESNHRGIETFLAQCKRTEWDCLNRTIVELKPVWPETVLTRRAGLNRTIVELKPFCKFHLKRHTIRLNRTIVELKPICARAKTNRVIALESNHRGIETHTFDQVSDRESLA